MKYLKSNSYPFLKQQKHKIKRCGKKGKESNTYDTYETKPLLILPEITVDKSKNRNM